MCTEWFEYLMFDAGCSRSPSADLPVTRGHMVSHMYTNVPSNMHHRGTRAGSPETRFLLESHTCLYVGGGN